MHWRPCSSSLIDALLWLKTQIDAVLTVVNGDQFRNGFNPHIMTPVKFALCNVDTVRDLPVGAVSRRSHGGAPTLMSWALLKRADFILW